MPACNSHQLTRLALRAPQRARAPLLTLLAALLAGLIAASCISTDGQAQEPVASGTQASAPALMVVVDGSGSMWGALGREGHSKLTATREALEAVLPKLASSHRLGLATFGPGCRTAGVVVAPTASDGAQAVTAPLAKFNPRGKGPLSAGLRAAAESLGPDDRGMLVLFHDGLDNCGEDQCALAATLAQDKPGLRVSTISLGMEPAEVAAIACVAKATGGRAFAVEDAEGVVQAMTEVAHLVGTAPDTLAAPVASAQPEASADGAAAGATTATPQLRTSGPPRLLASARLAPGGDMVSMPLSWRVTTSGDEKILHETVAPSLSIDLPAGGVRVEARSGRVVAFKDTEIASQGDSIVEVILDAGIVRFDTGAKRLASDAEEPLIRLEHKGEAQRTTPLWIARGKAVEAMLPPGDYQAVAEYGLARAAAPVRVDAGQSLNQPLPLEAGRLELASAPAGLTEVVYRLDVDDPDRPGGRRELTRTANAAPAFVLSTGTYYVTAIAGGQEQRRLVTVRSGEVTRETFNIELASLEVTATVNGGPRGREPLTLSVRPIKGNGAQRAGTAEQPVSLGRPLRLAPGSYRVQVRYGLDDAMAEREVRLGAGEAQRLTIDLKFAQIALDLSGSDGLARGALCEMKSAAGEIVWRTVELRPTHAVAPGQYALRCRTGEAVREFTVTAAAGQVTRIAPFER
ncbi:MAG: VWA domain-containing protein [Hyphomicrobiaceae bacterium]|nr:VWA domain-containing protein [Hyphomicrobiaceae bacterium]